MHDFTPNKKKQIKSSGMRNPIYSPDRSSSSVEVQERLPIPPMGLCAVPGATGRYPSLINMAKA